MNYPNSYQNLELSEIEAIVAEIEREKEAGEYSLDEHGFRSEFFCVQRQSASDHDWQLLQLGKLQCHKERQQERVQVNDFVFNILTYCIMFLFCFSRNSSNFG